MVNKGVALRALKRSEEAIQVYDEAIALYRERSEPQIFGQVARAMINKGIAFDNLERYADAEKAFRQAIELNPDLTDAYIQLIKLLLKGSDEV